VLSPAASEGSGEDAALQPAAFAGQDSSVLRYETPGTVLAWWKQAHRLRQRARRLPGSEEAARRRGTSESEMAAREGNRLRSQAGPASGEQQTGSKRVGYQESCL